MKIKTLVLTIFALLSFLAAAQAQESQLSEDLPLSVTVIGAANFNDVRYLITNLKRSAQVTRLSPTLSSKGLIEYQGSYHGSSESLVDEIRGLAQDRFAVETPKQKGNKSAGQLSLTLRKITAGSSSD